MKSGKKIKRRSGVLRSFVLGPIICNFTLAYLTNNFFADPFFTKNLTFNNLKRNIYSIQVNRFLLGYADDLMIKVISQDEADYALKKLTSQLFKAGLKINSENLFSCDLSIKSKFD